MKFNDWLEQNKNEYALSDNDITWLTSLYNDYVNDCTGEPSPTPINNFNGEPISNNINQENIEEYLGNISAVSKDMVFSSKDCKFYKYNEEVKEWLPTEIEIDFKAMSPHNHFTSLSPSSPTKHKLDNVVKRKLTEEEKRNLSLHLPLALTNQLDDLNIAWRSNDIYTRGDDIYSVVDKVTDIELVRFSI